VALPSGPRCPNVLAPSAVPRRRYWFRRPSARWPHRCQTAMNGDVRTFRARFVGRGPSPRCLVVERSVRGVGVRRTSRAVQETRRITEQPYRRSRSFCCATSAETQTARVSRVRRRLPRPRPERGKLRKGSVGRATCAWSRSALSNHRPDEVREEEPQHRVPPTEPAESEPEHEGESYVTETEDARAREVQHEKERVPRSGGDERGEETLPLVIEPAARTKRADIKRNVG